MILCPQCATKQLDGTIFCTECGMQLAYADGRGTQTFSRELAGTDQFAPPGPAVALAPEHGRLAVRLLNTGDLIPLEDREEFTLGRFSEGQPVVPDVDLSAFGAYENGVSRLHAVVRFRAQQLTITDLGSSNGTYINGARVLPDDENRLSSGDVIALGKLRFQLVSAPE